MKSIMVAISEFQSECLITIYNTIYNIISSYFLESVHTVCSVLGVGKEVKTYSIKLKYHFPLFYSTTLICYDE